MLEPDRPTIEVHVNAIFRYAGADGFIPLRAFYEGDNRVFRAPAVRMNGSLVPFIDTGVDYARRCANEPKAVVLCPPVAVFSNKDNAREEPLLGLALTVELDRAPRAGLQALEQILGRPTEVVRSGGVCADGEPKLHLYWRLSRPARGKEALAALKRARELATRISGGDASNISIVHPIRLPGSWHRKGEPRLCEIESVSPDTEIDLDEALEAWLIPLTQVRLYVVGGTPD